jgi:Flp pilus assembly protein TadD
LGRALGHSLGIAAWETGNPQEAFNNWEQALRINPDYAEAHNDLGIALERMGSLDDAIVHYERAVGLAPDFIKARNNLANALMRRGRVTGSNRPL